tara:strand:+ start:5861 stop:7744 length:1884 start_codon:yes stop_codon:yes gene_type:complete
VKAITGELDLNLFNADDENNTAFDPSVTLEGLKTAGEFALDMTPVVGDIKAATELPEDMRMARALIEEGYEEGDIIDMGLGGALGALSVAGFIPAGGAVADVLKKGVKETAKDRLSKQTQDALITPKRAKQLEQAKRLPASERRAFLKQANRPTPKIFHGARSMSEPRGGEPAKFNSAMFKFRTQYIKNPMNDIFSDKESKEIIQSNKSVDDIISDQGYGRFGIPVGQPDGSIDVANITFKKGKDGSLDVHFIDVDKNIVEKEAVASISPAEDGGIEYGKLLSKLNNVSELVSPSPAVVGKKRIEAIREEGLSPFSAFKGEAGLAGPTATGEHSELKEKMMSFSRDPLVAMKPGFGGGRTENIIYSDLPPELTRDMSPDEYLKSVQEGRVIPQLSQGQIGYTLPKSVHLEAEEAITNPELLDAKVLADNPKLQDKVQRGQDMVNDILNKKDTIYIDVQYPESAEGIRQMYNRTREVLNKLQSLGQFTEQYGARGTYDDLLETLLDDNKSSDFLAAIQMLPKNLPDGQRKKIATSVRSILNRIGARSISGPKFKAEEALSGVSDKDLNDALFSTKSLGAKKKQELDDAGLGIFMDGNLDLDRLGYKDLKRLLFLGTQKMNRGGLASRK